MLGTIIWGIIDGALEIILIDENGKETAFLMKKRIIKDFDSFFSAFVSALEEALMKYSGVLAIEVKIRRFSFNGEISISDNKKEAELEVGMSINGIYFLEKATGDWNLEKLLSKCVVKGFNKFLKEEKVIK